MKGQTIKKRASVRKKTARKGAASKKVLFSLPEHAVAALERIARYSRATASKAIGVKVSKSGIVADLILERDRLLARKRRA